MRLLFSLFGLLMLIACGKAADSNPTSTSKDLFSSWARQTPSTGLILDFTGKGFSSNPFKYLPTSGGECDCTLAFSGTQSSGTLIISGCSFKAGSAASDPGCTSLNSSAGYSKTSDTLTTCPTDGSTCATWK